MKGYGLQATPKDENDFPLERMFGAAAVSDLPRSFNVSKPIVIKDQGETDMCTAYAITAVSEDQEDVELDPYFTFARTKSITGDLDAWGADLRSACKSTLAENGGFLPKIRTGELIVPTEDTRNAIVRTQYSMEDMRAARAHAKQTFFAVGAGEPFEMMRSAMWQTRNDERSIFTGIDWNPEWNRVQGGAIDISIGIGGRTYGHAVKFFGWDLNDWILAQLSNGTEIGEGGIFKLHRDVVNRFCTYGAFTLMDIPREVAEYELGRVGFFKYWCRSIFS